MNRPYIGVQTIKLSAQPHCFAICSLFYFPGHLLQLPTYGIQAAERSVQGSFRALGADDGSLGVRGVVTGQGLMVRVGGLSGRVALRRRIGASVAGD